MEAFDSIRPYSDTEVTCVLTRLLKDETFIQMLTHFRFPFLAKHINWLIKPFVTKHLRKELGAITSVASLQDKVEEYVTRTITKATKGITYSGIEHIATHKASLFLANHRDIVMDPAFVNYAVYHAGLPTPRIAIGDNLIKKPFVSDLMRLNKSFIVRRSLTDRREKLAAYKLLSAYISHSIQKDSESIWIAQAEGRAKDGNDRTDSAILKMLYMSRKDEKFSEVIRSLNIIPVSISYEYDPCDLMKARELYLIANTGKYDKKPGEDEKSIALGITGYKGHVHICFGQPIEKPPEDSKQLAAILDEQILKNYHLFPVHYLAYSMWNDSDPEIVIPPIEKLFSLKEIQEAKVIWEQRLALCPEEQKSYLILQYAQPVLNQYSL